MCCAFVRSRSSTNQRDPPLSRRERVAFCFGSRPECPDLAAQLRDAGEATLTVKNAVAWRFNLSKGLIPEVDK